MFGITTRCRDCVFFLWTVVESTAGLPVKVDEWCTHPRRQMVAMEDACPFYTIYKETDE